MIFKFMFTIPSIIIIITSSFVFTWLNESPDRYYMFSDDKEVSIQELQQFIANDKTNENLYVEGKYVCSSFSKDVIDNAKQYNYRVGYAIIDNDIFKQNHAIVAFDTTNGIYFLEPQLDLLFSESKMNEMKSKGIYDIQLEEDGLVIVNFNITMSDYSIMWR